MLISLGEGQTPQIADNAWVAPNATLAGAVTLEDGASIWYNAVLRADNEPITIGANSNVQDNCALHVEIGISLVIGRGVSVGHNAVIHGATIEDDVLVGMGAIVMNGAHIGAESLIAAGALVPENANIPPRSLVTGVPGRVVRELTDDQVERLRQNGQSYLRLREVHRNASVHNGVV